VLAQSGQHTEGARCWQKRLFYSRELRVKAQEQKRADQSIFKSDSTAAPGQTPQKLSTKTHSQAGFGDVTSPCKNLVKTGKATFLRQAIQEPIFSVANTDFEGSGSSGI
jgi:hypothetical protein